MELISVVVPVYNTAKYLRQCVDSLLKQTYTEFEIILVDDGSSDECPEICDEYHKCYTNIKTVHKKNAGLGFARNTGIENAAGKYITFFDSDDWADEDYLKKLYMGLLDNDVDMCKGGLNRVDDNGTIINKIAFHDEVFLGDEAKSKMLPRMIGSKPECKDSFEMCVCGSLYVLEIINTYNIRFHSERELISEDLIFNIDYMQYARGGCSISFCGYNYRINYASVTMSYRPKKFEAITKYHKYVKRKLSDLGYDNETILRLDRIFLVYLRGCIEQERDNVSTLSFSSRGKRIKEICQDKYIQKIVQAYPVVRMGCKQYKQILFILLVRFRFSCLLHLLAEIGKV